MRRRIFFTSLLAAPLAVLAGPAPAAAMTKAQMQSLAAAITNAGYPATLIQDDEGAWRVRSSTDVAFSVNVNAVKALADAQGVNAFVAQVEYR